MTRWGVLLAVACIAGCLGEGFVGAARRSVPLPPGVMRFWAGRDPRWLTTLDSLTLVPAEYSVGGAAFLATLLLGVAVTRWRSDGDAADE